MGELGGIFYQYGAVGGLCLFLIYFIVNSEKHHRDDRKDMQKIIQDQYDGMKKLIEQVNETRHDDVVKTHDYLHDLKAEVVTLRSRS